MHLPRCGTKEQVVYAWVRLCDDDPKYYWHYRLNRHGAFLDSAQLRCFRQIKWDLVSSPNAVVPRRSWLDVILDGLVDNGGVARVSTPTAHDGLLYNYIVLNPEEGLNC